MEATGFAHGPIVARREGNASGAKGPWAVAGEQRTPADTLWSAKNGENEHVEPWSKLGGRHWMRAIA